MDENVRGRASAWMVTWQGVLLAAAVVVTGALLPGLAGPSGAAGVVGRILLLAPAAVVGLFLLARARARTAEWHRAEGTGPVRDTSAPAPLRVAADALATTGAVVGVFLVAQVAGAALGAQAVVGRHGSHAAVTGATTSGPVVHALHETAMLAPLVLAAAIALRLLAEHRSAEPTWRRRVRAPRRPGAGRRWAAAAPAAVLVGTSLVAVPQSATAAVVPAAPACTAETADRVYDVAAVHAFIPFSRWENDTGEVRDDPVVPGAEHETDGDEHGMLFVLQQDKAAVQNWHVPIVGTAENGYAGDPADGRRLRPRPLVLRANVGECVQVTLTNELTPAAMAGWLPQRDPHVSMYAFGVSYNPNTSGGGAVGYSADSTVGVGESVTYHWVAPQSEGLYLFRDAGMAVGAEEDGGGAEHGLYGGLAVEPAGARWFDPVSGRELSSQVPDQQYAAVADQNGDLYVDAVIADTQQRRYRESVLISQDILPIDFPVVDGETIEGFERFGINYGSDPEHKRIAYNESGQTWCEECASEETVLSSWVYGDPGLVKLASGSGPWLPTEPDWGDDDPLAAPGGLPAGNIEDCGLLLTTSATEDRPVSCYVANVTRAYQGDPIKLRFGHAGVYETHVFHLHAHTWPAEPDDAGPAGAVPPRPTPENQPRATTIDSLTYSPWTAFTADLNYGAGGRIGTVGDSIYHCHLYTHFSHGFWSLMRVHDALEDGTGGMPDGTRVTQWAPLRAIGADLGLASSVPPVKNPPSVDVPGYPRFIPGEFGSRAPQPPGSVWQREFDAGGNVVLDDEGRPVEELALRLVDTTALDPALLEATQDVVTDAVTGAITFSFAGGTTEPVPLPATAGDVAGALEALGTIRAVRVKGEGSASDPWRVGLVLWTSTPDLTLTAQVEAPATVTVTPSDGFDPADPVQARTAYQLAVEQHVTRTYHDPDYMAGGDVDPDRAPRPGAPVVDPCPADARTVTYRASVIQLPLVYNGAGWRDVQGRIIVADEDVDAVLAGTKAPEPFFYRVNAGDCIDFELTNRTPNVIGDDAYQQLVMTNMLGAHIHLVNFDVLASDGASNGWNYQQAAFSEELAAFNEDVLAGDVTCTPGAPCLPAMPTNRDPVAEAADPRGSWLSNGQTIKERWYADYELRTVFMHDHHFAGTLQNRGLFSALVVEPPGFDSRDPFTGEYLQPLNTASRGEVCADACTGTAHGAAMDLVGPGSADDFREFGVAVQDFTPLFTRSATHADILDPRNAIEPPTDGPLRTPEGDQGGMGINYRSEPFPLRQFKGTPPTPPADPTVPISDAALEAAGWVDPAYVFSSRVWGDPATPLLRANRGDNVRFRLIQGAHEEMHNFTVHGTRWRKDPNDPASPYINARPVGVSEAFNIDDVAVDCGLGTTGTCFPYATPGTPRVSDFLYGGTGLENMWFGMWGILRVFDQTTGNGGLLRLPDNDAELVTGYPLPPPGNATEVPRAIPSPSCPAGAPETVFDVSAIDLEIEYNRYGDHDPYGLAYVLTEDVEAVRSGEKPLEPLVLRVNEGDCITVNLTNSVDWDAFDAHGRLGTLDGDAPIALEPVWPDPEDADEDGDDDGDDGPQGVPWVAGHRVSMHPSLVRYDVRTSDGTTVGYNLDQTAGPGETVEYTWYADEIVYQDPANEPALTDGELGAIPLTEFGDVRGHRHHGLLAALVVGPPDATFHDPVTGAQVRTGAQVDVHPGADGSDYRDAVLIHHNGLNVRDADGEIVTDPILDDWPDAGERAISYRNAPVHHRLGLDRPVTDHGPPEVDPRGAPFSGADFGERLANAFSTTYPIGGEPIGDPDTPIVRAHQGDPLRVHVVQSADRARMVQYAVGGHNWLEHAFDAGSVRSGVQGSLAAGSAVTLHMEAAGGDLQAVGDYRYGVENGTMGLSSGSWGIVRVYQRPAPGTERILVPLERCQNPYSGCNPLRVINERLTPEPGAPALTLTADPDVAFVGDTVEVRGALTAGGVPLAAGHEVTFTWPGSDGPQIVQTGPNGVATVPVPVTAYPAATGGVLEVTGTATVEVTSPHEVFPLTGTVQIWVVDPDDVTPPTVESVEPSDGALDVIRSTAVTLTFSERIDPATLEGAVRLRPVGGTAADDVAATVVEDHTENIAVSVVTLTPDVPLARYTKYEVVVDATVADFIGNTLAEPFRSTFVTTSTVFSRVFGANRYATAAEISLGAFEPGVERVYVASGADFPDALAAGPSAALGGAPILLTRPDRLPDVTAAELERLAPQEIVVLGGPAAVRPQVFDALTAHVGATGDVRRVEGLNRYATAAEISRELFPGGAGTVFVASGENFPDALAAGPAAAALGASVLLVRSGSLPDVTAAEIQRLAPENIVLLGGTQAVSAAVETALGGLGAATVTRIAGATRYETAAQVSSTYFPDAPVPLVFVGTGANFPDALAITPVAGAAGAPLLLVPRARGIPDAVADELLRLLPAEVRVVGGPEAITEAQYVRLRQLLE